MIALFIISFLYFCGISSTVSWTYYLEVVMGSVFLFHEDFIFRNLWDWRPLSRSSDPANVWKDQPTPGGVILYSFITPVICSIGICGNTLSLMVLKRRELIGSVYTYLAVMAASNLIMSIILFLGGLSRGVLYYHGWAEYDALIGLPLTGMVNLMNVLATVGVTIDRVIYLWNPVQCTSPRFCNRKIARRVMLVGLMLSIFCNLPYCFIFYCSHNHKLMTTPFFDSRFYAIFNWFMLVTFSVIPALILIFGNGFLIKSLRKSSAISLRVYGRKRKDHNNLTFILVIIIMLFLISEIPADLVSRTKAVSILFSGDHGKENSKLLETIRQICTLIGALNITGNFVFYYLFSPAFCRAMQKTVIRKKQAKKAPHYKVNLFLVETFANKNNNCREILDLDANKRLCRKISAKRLYNQNDCYVYAQIENCRSDDTTYNNSCASTIYADN